MDWLRSYRPDLVPRYEALYARGAYAPKAERERLSRLVRAGRRVIGLRRDPAGDPSWRRRRTRAPTAPRHGAGRVSASRDSQPPAARPSRPPAAPAPAARAGSRTRRLSVSPSSFSLRTSRLKGSFSRPTDAARSAARTSGCPAISSSVCARPGPVPAGRVEALQPAAQLVELGRGRGRPARAARGAGPRRPSAARCARSGRRRDASSSRTAPRSDAYPARARVVGGDGPRGRPARTESIASSPTTVRCRPPGAGARAVPAAEGERDLPRPDAVEEAAAEEHVR